MSYDDEPEWKEPVTEQIPLKIEVTGWTLDGLLEVVARRTQELAQKKIDYAIDKIVTRAVQDAVDSEIAKRVAPVVDKILADGWAVTDDYGRSKGVKSVKDYVLDKLAARDPYNGSNTMIEKRMGEMLSQLIDRALQQDIEAARKKLREQLDGVVASKVAETIKNAIGLK